MNSSLFVLLFATILFCCFLSCNSLLVKRQSTEASFGGSEPVPVNLNEPVAAVGLQPDQEQMEAEEGKNTDALYDTVDEQSSTMTSTGTTPSSPQPTELSSDENPSTTATSSVEAQKQFGEETTLPNTPEPISSVEIQKKLEEETSLPTTSEPPISSVEIQKKIEEETTLQTTTPEPTSSASTTRKVSKLAPKKEIVKGKGHKAPIGTSSVASTTISVSVDAPSTTLKPAIQRNCNSEKMRTLILENIHAKPSIAKRQIQAKVAAEINGKIDVVCAKNAFSYIVNSEVFCEAERDGVICLCFKQQGS